MKVCVPSFGPTLDSRVQPIFGRCEFFLLVDPETLVGEAGLNPYAALGGKAGVESAELIAKKGVRFVLAARVGPKAQEIFNAAGVEIVSVDGETVREVVEAFRKAKLAAPTGVSIHR